MFLDNELKVIDGADVTGSDPYYSLGSIFIGNAQAKPADLTAPAASPAIGEGESMVAVIFIDSYTRGAASTGLTVHVITGGTSTLDANRKKIATSPIITHTQLTAGAASATGQKPIVVRISPEHHQGTKVSGGAEDYLGIELDHASGAPDTMTVTAYFVKDHQSSPANTHFASGFKVL